MAKGIVRYVDAGLMEYEKCLKLQTDIFDKLVLAKKPANKHSNNCCDAEPTLILCEHPHVYTLGRSGAETNLLIDDKFLKKINAQYYHTDRGGDITYHGPNQLVGYPILDLELLKMGLKEYVHKLETTIIDTIAEFGIKGEQRDDATGVWISKDARGGERKIAAIGVRSSRFITMHGFALNVNPDMNYYSYINPCGITDRGVTSMTLELESIVTVDEVAKVFVDKFKQGFGVELIV